MNFLGDNRWLVFVVPGFISLFVAGFVSDLPEIPDSHLPIIYVALTAISTFIPLVFVHAYGVISGKAFYIGDLLYSKLMIISTFICSIIFGFIFGIANSTDYFSSGLRDILGDNVILKSSQSQLLYVLFKNSYNDKFVDGQPHINKKETNRYARIVFFDKRNSYEGVIAQFSVDANGQQVYLSPACVLDGGGAKLIHGPGVWLDVKDSKEIQFIYSSCSECAMAVERAAGIDPPVICPFR